MNKRSNNDYLSPNTSGFILIVVLIVIAISSLAALNFARSMLNTYESTLISNQRLQARFCAESGAQTVRLFLAYPRGQRNVDLGGTWNNPSLFQALNVMPDIDPARRGNFTIISPALDEFGNFIGIRYGLQNESAKLNLNALVQLDSLSGGTTASASTATDSGTGQLASQLASAASQQTGLSLATSLLMGIPGMTEDIADAILDWLDEDEEPRMYGAEYSDYYSSMQPAYRPANGPLQSIEQLLLVRGITPVMLFGYDADRNGYLDAAELSNMQMGVQPGAMPGSLPAAALDPTVQPPPPLGWSQYLTLHSAEKNCALDGTPRININSDDLATLYEDLLTVLDESTASYIIGFRLGGQAQANNPLATLASMAAAELEETDGALGQQLSLLSVAPQSGTSNNTTVPWDPTIIANMDLSQQQGSVRFNQVLDIYDSTVSIGGQGGQGQQTTYSSPLSSLPGELALSAPMLMDYLTTVDAAAIPGRINIMECPQEILNGIPGFTTEKVEEILAARNDGSDSETRNFETWLVNEGYFTMDEMRALLPLITCGGDVYKAQIIGYMEGGATFSRIEAIISGAGELPEIQFFRRLDHLERGFDVTTLGQRFDAGMQGGNMMQ